VRGKKSVAIGRKRETYERRTRLRWSSSQHRVPVTRQWRMEFRSARQPLWVDFQILITPCGLPVHWSKTQLTVTNKYSTQQYCLFLILDWF
jgi:hypothetical protein